MLPHQIETNPPMLKSSKCNLTSCRPPPPAVKERGMGAVWRQLSHNEATGFVSSSEDLVNPELCRAALDRKERPAGAEPPSMTTSFILCHCIQIYYTPPPAHTGPLWRRITVEKGYIFRLFPKSNWHKLRQREIFLCVLVRHNGEATVKNGHAQLESQVPQTYKWSQWSGTRADFTHRNRVQGYTPDLVWDCICIILNSNNQNYCWHAPF